MQSDHRPDRITASRQGANNGLRWLALLVIAVWSGCFFLVQRLYRQADESLEASSFRAVGSVAPAAAVPAASNDSYPITTSVEKRQTVSNTSGNMLFKCLDEKKAVSIQSQPCALGSIEVWARPYSPDRRPAGRPQLYRPPATDTIYISPSAASASQRDIALSRCAQAKAQDASWREIRGLKVTHEELRRWSDLVYEACKGT